MHVYLKFDARSEKNTKRWGRYWTKEKKWGWVGEEDGVRRWGYWLDPSDANTAALDELVLDGVISDVDAAAPAPEGDDGRAPDVEVVAARDERADLPTDPTVDLYEQEDRAHGLVLGQGHRVVRRHRHVRPVYERRPHVDLLVAL